MGLEDLQDGVPALSIFSLDLNLNAFLFFLFFFLSLKKHLEGQYLEEHTL